MDTVSKGNSSADDRVKSVTIKLELNSALMKSEEFSIKLISCWFHFILYIMLYITSDIIATSSPWRPSL